MIRAISIGFAVLFMTMLDLWRPAWAASPDAPRLALVIGEGSYANARQAAKTTAVDDAGLVSYQLQQAGFDVTGGGDVDRQGFETLAATFVAKLREAGPNSVAVVYVAGLGLQMNGDNRIVPIDARLASLGAVATETISVNELLAQFQSVPASVRIAIFDMSRPLPFPIAGQVAPGLAAVNPMEGLLVAFSQQPGYLTQEVAGRTYGPYASALAEAIRAPGLPPDELFGRVRLRVQEDSKGGQLPWDTSGLTSDFTFFQAQPGTAPRPVARPRRIAGLPIADAFAWAIERDTIEGYRAFIAAYPGTSLARRAAAIVAARREAFFWERTVNDGSPRAYWTYLRYYPHGAHGPEARGRLQALNQTYSPPPDFLAESYDIPPPPPDEHGYYVPYDQWYELPPPPPPPVIFLPRPVYVFEQMPPPRRERPGFLPVPAHIPLPPRIVAVPAPVHIRSPAHIAPLPLAVPSRTIRPERGAKKPVPGQGAGGFRPAGGPPVTLPGAGSKPATKTPGAEPKAAPGTPLPMPGGPHGPAARPEPRAPGKPQAPTPGAEPKAAPGTPLPMPGGPHGPGARPEPRAPGKPQAPTHGAEPKAIPGTPLPMPGGPHGPAARPEPRAPGKPQAPTHGAEPKAIPGTPLPMPGGPHGPAARPEPRAPGKPQAPTHGAEPKAIPGTPLPMPGGPHGPGASPEPKTHGRPETPRHGAEPKAAPTAPLPKLRAPSHPGLKPEGRPGPHGLGTPSGQPAEKPARPERPKARPAHERPEKQSRHEPGLDAPARKPTKRPEPLKPAMHPQAGPAVHPQAKHEPHAQARSEHHAPAAHRPCPPKEHAEKKC